MYGWRVSNLHCKDHHVHIVMLGGIGKGTYQSKFVNLTITSYPHIIASMKQDWHSSVETLIVNIRISSYVKSNMISLYVSCIPTTAPHHFASDMLSTLKVLLNMLCMMSILIQFNTCWEYNCMRVGTSMEWSQGRMVLNCHSISHVFLPTGLERVQGQRRWVHCKKWGVLQHP